MKLIGDAYNTIANMGDEALESVTLFVFLGSEEMCPMYFR